MTSQFKAYKAYKWGWAWGLLLWSCQLIMLILSDIGITEKGLFLIEEWEHMNYYTAYALLVFFVIGSAFLYINACRNPPSPEGEIGQSQSGQ